MKNKPKGLQKLTNTENKFNELLKKNKLETAHLDGVLTDNESNEFLAHTLKTLYSLKHQQHDDFFLKIEGVIPADLKNQLWEANHNRIMWAIPILIRDYGRMPSKNEISEKSGLSRQTIHKHLAEFSNHPLYLEQVEKFRIMRTKVMATVLRLALNGDVKAAKLFLTFTDNSATKGNINTQNNYLQINQIKITQENIFQLPPEQLSQIEAILMQGLRKD